ALQHDQLARPKTRSDGAARGADELQVRFPGICQGCGDADEDRVGFSQSVELRCGLKAGRVHASDGCRRYLMDVTLTVAEAHNLRGIRVEAEDGPAREDECFGQGQADVAQAEDSHSGLFLADL